MDAETGLLPAAFTYPGIALGLLLAWKLPLDSSGTEFLMRRVWRTHTMPSRGALSFLDAVVAAGSEPGSSSWLGRCITSRGSAMVLALATSSLMAMVGTFLGLKLTVLVVFLAPVMGSLFALTLTRPATRSSRRSDSVSFLSREVPFGVFLGTSALISLFLRTDDLELVPGNVPLSASEPRRVRSVSPRLASGDGAREPGGSGATAVP